MYLHYNIESLTTKQQKFVQKSFAVLYFKWLWIVEFLAEIIFQLPLVCTWFTIFDELFA